MSTPRTACECGSPGYCQRHHVRKNAAWHRLCQQSEKYFAAWEQGRGPGQQSSQPGSSRQSRRRPRGLGDILKRMLGCCSFPHVKRFNEWGPEDCLARLDEAVQLVQSAGHRGGTPLSDHAARRLIEIAIEQASDVTRA